MAYRAPTNQAGRKALARARGFKSFFQYRRAIMGRAAPRPGRVQFGGGIEHVNTRAEGTLRAAIRRAAKNDLMLYPTVTVLLDPGDKSHPRTWPTHNIDLWGRWGYRADLAVELMGDGYAFGMIYGQLAELAVNAQGSRIGPVLSVLLRVDVEDPR